MERANNSFLMNEISFKLKPLRRLEKVDFNPSTDDSKIQFEKYKQVLKAKNVVLNKISEEQETLQSKELDPNVLFRLGSGGKERYLRHYKELDRITELDVVNEKESGPVTSVLQKQRKFRLFPSKLGMLSDAAADTGVLNLK